MITNPFEPWWKSKEQEVSQDTPAEKRYDPIVGAQRLLQPMSSRPPQVSTEQEYAKLEEGTTYTRPDGKLATKGLVQEAEAKTYSRLEKAKELYPYLKDKDFDYVENLTDDKKAGFLEFWEPGDEGPPDGSVKRPEGIGIDRMGIEIRNPKTRPIDILGDYVSHEGVKSDPKLKDIYDRFLSTLTDEQLKVKYEYEKKNYGEDRPFEQWAERSGRPGMFRGYTFDQFSEEEIKEAYTDEQLDILDEAKEYLDIDNTRVKTQGVKLDEEPIQEKLIYDGRLTPDDTTKPKAEALSNEEFINDWGKTYQTDNDPVKNKAALKRLDSFDGDIKPEATTAMQVAGAIFDGDKNVTSDQIIDYLTKVGIVESNFSTKKQKGDGPARSYWQVEPATALDLSKNSRAFFGDKFNTAFKKYAKDGETAIVSLSKMSKEEIGQLLLDDDRLAASFAAAKYIATR